MPKGYVIIVIKSMTKNHRCKFKETQLFTVEISGEVELEEEGSDSEILGSDETEMCISVNALTGNHSFSTMRVVGKV